MGPIYYYSTRGQVTRHNTNEHNLTNPPNLLPTLLFHDVYSDRVIINDSNLHHTSMKRTSEHWLPHC